MVPAKEAPSALAVNCATFAEVFAPVASGLSIISTGGLSTFSNTSQIKSAQKPLSSKSIGLFCAKPTDDAKSIVRSSISVFIKLAIKLKL